MNSSEKKTQVGLWASSIDFTHKRLFTRDHWSGYISFSTVQSRLSVANPLQLKLTSRILPSVQNWCVLSHYLLPRKTLEFVRTSDPCTSLHLNFEWKQDKPRNLLWFQPIKVAHLPLPHGTDLLWKEQRRFDSIWWKRVNVRFVHTQSSHHSPPPREL